MCKEYTLSNIAPFPEPEMEDLSVNERLEILSELAHEEIQDMVAIAMLKITFM